MESLYQLIHRSLTPEGILPEDFSLPKPDGNQIHFADGAMDGITIFHTATGEADTGLLEQAVWAANRDRMEEAQGLVPVSYTHLLKLYDITSVVLIIFYIPAGSNLRCVLFVQDWIKNRLFR